MPIDAEFKGAGFYPPFIKVEEGRKERIKISVREKSLSDNVGEVVEIELSRGDFFKLVEDINAQIRESFTLETVKEKS